jgi:NhaA family Na+:H+ antiporter
VHLVPILLALVPIGIFRWLLRLRITHPLVLAVPAVLAWGLVQSGGVHATVAGVLLGLVVPVERHGAETEDAAAATLAETVEHALRPWSAGVAVPLFAFFAAGVRFIDGGLGDAVRDPVAAGIVIALVVGKTVGVLGGTWLITRFTRAQLDEGLAWSDVLGVSALSGVGFTVSLLIGELAFGVGSARVDHVKLGVLAGSLLSAAIAAVMLRRRDRHYRALAARVAADAGP